MKLDLTMHSSKSLFESLNPKAALSILDTPSIRDQGCNGMVCTMEVMLVLPYGFENRLKRRMSSLLRSSGCFRSAIAYALFFLGSLF